MRQFFCQHESVHVVAWLGDFRTVCDRCGDEMLVSTDPETGSGIVVGSAWGGAMMRVMAMNETSKWTVGQC